MLVVIYVFNVNNPGNIDLVRLKKETEIIRDMPINGIVRIYDIVRYQSKPAVVIERFGEKTLTDLISFQEFDLPLFLKISLQLSSTIEELHSGNVVHKNLRPDNILMSGDTVKITDFGIFSFFKRIEDLYTMESTDAILPYISPEQTNRMNRTIDYRSDIYSLGVILYELFTGTRPFQSNNPIDIIHFHIAREPESPDRINQKIPAVVSQIIMKTIKKTPEERYQSAYGLHADFKRCYDAFVEKGSVDTFPIAKDDISSRFLIPKILVGRDREISLLSETYDSINASDHDTELVLVSGPPGVGKSSLILELQKNVIERNGFFISGKHVKIQNKLPYFSIMQAFQGLMNQILTESEDSIAEWKNAIISAIGENGRIITEVIPEIELLIGRQHEIRDINNVKAASERFNRVISSFIRTISSRKPLVMFLDDLQWADNGTLNLIRHIVREEEINSLMLVLSYRETNSQEPTPLNRLIIELEESCSTITRIPVTSLSSEQTAKYLGSFLNKDTNSLRMLGKLIHKKTGGNPLFINQFMKSIYENRSLSFRSGEGWCWDLDKIINFDITDNVVDLLSEKIKKLPHSMREIITISSCIGSTFSIDLVSELTNTPLDYIFVDISYLLGEEFVVSNNGSYRFAHDRIMEAAYSLIDLKTRESLHYRIGNTALNKYGENELDENIDFIVNQLISGSSFINTDEEKIQLIRLIIKAADKAKKSVAFQSAFDYLIKALELIDPDCWEKNHTLAVKVYTRTAEAAFHLADFSTMHYLCSEVIRNSITIHDKIPAYELIIESLYARNRLKEALRQGRTLLKELGYSIPWKPYKLHLIFSLLKIRKKLREFNPEDLLNIEDARDPNILAVIRSLSTLGVASYKTDPGLIPLLMFKILNLSLASGNAPETAYAFAAYGMILCGVFGKIDSGYEFGELARHLSERPIGIKFKAKTRHLIECMIRHWKVHLRETLDPIHDAYRLGLENGDVENATSSLNLHCVYSYLAGEPIVYLLEKMAVYQEEINRFKQEMNLNVSQLNPGVYILNMATKHQNKKLKFIKQ